jgi:broad specificity phosphatase PhoE
LQRAVETAKTIAKYHDNLEVRIEPELRELEVGELEGVPIADLGADFSHFLVQWHDGEGKEKLPGGESLADLQSRVWATAQRIVAEHQGNVVLVSHYFVILTIISAALGLPPSGIRRFRVSVGSISVLDFKNGVPCLASLGDTCHLK